MRPRRDHLSLRVLAGPCSPVACAALGVALSLTAIGPRLILDDYVLALRATGNGPSTRPIVASFDLFTFATGRPSENHAFIDRGYLLPWWADERLKISFFRPLTVLGHEVDFALFPKAPWLMYAHSLAWLGLAIVAVALLYRRIEATPKIAGLAAVLFAIDHTHGPVTAWISNRNALIATTLGVLCVWAHDRARRSADPPRLLLAGPILLFLALLSGEFAVGALAYLVSYAATIDKAKWVSRVASLAPYALVTALWRVAYNAAGYGAENSGAYLDPLRDARRFFLALPARLAALLGGELGCVPSDSFFLAPPARMPLIMSASLLTLVLAVYVVAPHLRRDSIARFWALGMVLSALPVAASFPGDRLLLFVGVGAMGLAARVCLPIIDRGIGRPGAGLQSTAMLAFAFLHMVLSPILLPLRSAQMQWLGRALAEGGGPLYGAADLRQRTIVVVNTPADFFVSYIQAEAAWHGKDGPARVYWLTDSGSAIEVTRTARDELTVKREGGFLTTPLEQLYRASWHPIGLGTQIRLSGMTAEVSATTANGNPLSVRFYFPLAVESESYLFLAWRDGRYEPFNLPAVGETARFPSEDVTSAILRGGGHGSHDAAL